MLKRLSCIAAAALLGSACGSVTAKDDAGSGEECEADQMSCSGTCVDTQTSQSHCGACDNACDSDQLCQAGDCSSAHLEITSSWPEATGWLDSDGEPIEMTFADHGLSGGLYECRTGPVSTIEDMAFEPCDGADGTGATHAPTPVADTEEGTYRTEMRVALGDYQSDVIAYDFYAHRSLDSTPACAAGFTDEQIFTAASSELPDAPSFDSTADVFRPFLHIPFKDIIVGFGMKAGGGWNDLDTGDDYPVDLMSLRRRFVLSEDRKLLLIHRVFESRNSRLGGRGAPHHDCANRFKFGGRSRFDCRFFVLNSRGQAVCLEGDDAGNLQSSLGRTFDNGWVKLKRRDYDDGQSAFSTKFMGDDCPNGCQPWELALPE